MYKLLKNTITGETNQVLLDLNDGNQIVFGIDNPDSSNYQAYLKWVAEGNTPLPADNNQ